MKVKSGIPTAILFSSPRGLRQQRSSVYDLLLPRPRAELKELLVEKGWIGEQFVPNEKYHFEQGSGLQSGSHFEGTLIVASLFPSP